MDKPTYIGIDIGKFNNSCSAPTKRPKMFKNNGQGTAKLLHHCLQIAPANELFFVIEASSEYSNTCALTLLESSEARADIVPTICVTVFLRSKINAVKTAY